MVDNSAIDTDIFTVDFNSSATKTIMAFSSDLSKMKAYHILIKVYYANLGPSSIYKTQ